MELDGEATEYNHLQPKPEPEPEPELEPEPLDGGDRTSGEDDKNLVEPQTASLPSSPTKVHVEFVAPDFNPQARAIQRAAGICRVHGGGG